MRRLIGKARDAVVIGGFTIGWGAVRRMPARAAYPLFDRIADLAVARNGKGVRRLRSNYAKVRPELDAAALDRLVRAGMRSYMRYYCEAFRLPDRTRQEIVAATTCHGKERVLQALSEGNGAVLFVGHCGNFDHAAAWAAHEIAPVTTVAERLEPEKLFEEFVAYREAIQFTVIPLTGGPNPFGELRRAVQEGRFICLAADRDLTSNGVEVDYFGRTARMAKGPAALAMTMGVPLFATAIHYEKDPTSPLGGYRTIIDISERLHPRVETDNAAKVQDLTQQCADHLAAMITEHTSSWHMLQRVFVEDLDPRKAP